MNFAWCKGPDVGLPKPDLVCFLNVSEEAALARADFGGERYEKKEFQNKVAEFLLVYFSLMGTQT
jgi:dTMP kinase